jgi:hypothetical protein
MPSTTKLILRLLLALAAFAPAASAAVPNTSCASAWCLRKGVTTHASNVGLADAAPVWFSYTPQTTGGVTFSTCEGYAPLGLGIKPTLTLFSSCGGAQVASGTSSPVCSGYQQLTATLNAGTTYFLRATPPSNAFGYFSVTTTGGNGGCPSAAPINDTCINAFPIRIGDIALGTTVSATPEGFPGPICDTTPTAPGVWYTFTGPAGGARVSLDTCGQDTDHDTVLSVFTGSCTGAGLTCLTSNDDLCDVASRVIFDTVANQTYFILVSGYLGSTGNFQLRCASGPPANDLCSGAILLPQTFPPTTLTGTTINAEVDTAGIPVCEGFQRSTQSVWYKLIGAGQPVTIDTCNAATDFPTRLTVFSGGCGGLTCVTPASRGTCPSDQGIGFGGTSLTFLSQQGVEYLVLVDSSAAGGTGNFKITATQGVVNDTCDGALLLVPGATVLGDTTFGTADSVPICHGNASSGPYSNAPGLWYTFFGTGGSVQLVATHTVPSSGRVAYVDVFSGNCATPICRFATQRYPEQTRTVPTEAGRQYWALVRIASSSFGPDGLRGPFTLSFQKYDHLFDHLNVTRSGGPTSSISLGNNISNGNNYRGSTQVVSRDGRFVVFRSSNNDLSDQPLQNLSVDAVFVRDRLLRTTRCISVAPNDGIPNSASGEASISGNGRYVFFSTLAGNVAPGAGGYHVVCDQTTGVLRRLSNNLSTSIIKTTDDGSLLLLEKQLFLFTQAGGSIPYAVTASGQTILTQGATPNEIHPADMTPDGRFVLYLTARQMVPTDTNGNYDLYLRDRSLGMTELVSVRDDGTACSRDSGSFLSDFASLPRISSDGRYVVFFSKDDFIVPGDNNLREDLFYRDRHLGHTRMVTTREDGSIAPAFPPTLDVGILESGGEVEVLFGASSQTAFGFVHDIPSGLGYWYYAKSLATGKVRAFMINVGKVPQTNTDIDQFRRTVIPVQGAPYIVFLSRSTDLAWTANGTSGASENQLFLLETSRGWLNTTPGATGNITDANNWPLGVPPGDTGSASFASPNVFSVNFPQDFTTASLIVSAGDVTYNLNGYTYFVTREAEVGTAFDIDTVLRPRSGTIFCGSGRIGGKGLLDLSGNAKWKFVDNTAASAGEVRVTSPARIETSTTLGTLSLRTGSKLTGDGVIDASVISTGEILPGLPTTPAAGPGAGGTQVGTLTISRNFEQVNANQTPGQFGGTLRISLDGDAGPGVPGGHDRLIVGQTAYLGGGLIVTKNPAFDPPLGTTFAPLTAGTGIVGGFDVAYFPGLTNNRYFRLSYDAAPNATMDANAAVTALAGGVAQVTVETLNGAPSFADPKTPNVTGQPRDAVLGDFNDDGFLDLALSVPNATNPTGVAGNVVILLNAGNDANGVWQGFGSQITKATGRNPAGLCVGRFRGAALPLDIVVACESEDQFRHIRNSGGPVGGTRTFTDGPQVSSGGSRPVSVVSINLDSDTIPDIAVANQGTVGSTNTGNVGVFLTTVSSGNATFVAAPGSPITVGANPVDLAARDITGDGASDFDIDADGRADLATADFGSGTVSVLLRAPAGGTFQTVRYVNVSGPPVRLEPGGLDNPKELNDLATICVPGSGGGVMDVLLRPDNPPPSGDPFTPPVSIPLGAAPRSIAVADLDADGDDDAALVVDGATPGATALRIIRNDTRTSSGVVFADQGTVPSTNPVLVLSGNVDNDAAQRDDLVTINNTAVPQPPPEGGGESASLPTALIPAPPVSVLPAIAAVVPPACVGDLNGDNAVNTADLTRFLGRFGTTVTPGGPGDLNFDGVVNTADLTRFLGRFGQTCP